MSDLRAAADRAGIEALRGEFADAAMMPGYDRFASLYRDRYQRTCDADPGATAGSRSVAGRSQWLGQSLVSLA